MLIHFDFSVSCVDFDMQLFIILFEKYFSLQQKNMLKYVKLSYVNRLPQWETPLTRFQSGQTQISSSCQSCLIRVYSV